jgi:DNA-binding NtrC family response regulator
MQALATTNGNVTAAAKKLGISRRTLHRKINEMNVAKSQGGPGSATDRQPTSPANSA